MPGLDACFDHGWLGEFVPAGDHFDADIAGSPCPIGLISGLMEPCAG